MLMIRLSAALLVCLPLLQLQLGASTAGEEHAGVTGQHARLDKCSPVEHYTAGDFFGRLVRVANETDPAGVPSKFESQFHLKLGSSPIAGIVTYTPKCKWVTAMQVSVFSQNAGTGGPSASFVVGDLLQPESLNFGAPERGECLSQTMVDAMLKADGWSSGAIRWETITWIYKKGGASFSFGSGKTYGFGDKRIVCFTEVRFFLQGRVTN